MLAGLFGLFMGLVSTVYGVFGLFVGLVGVCVGVVCFVRYKNLYKLFVGMDCHGRGGGLL